MTAVTSPAVSRLSSAAISGSSVLLAAPGAGLVTRPLFQHPNDVTVQFSASGRLRRCHVAASRRNPRLRWALVTFAKSERAELCDLFDKVGPQAPTLCEGWDTHDLAAHLWIRETDPVEPEDTMIVPRRPSVDAEMIVVEEDPGTDLSAAPEATLVRNHDYGRMFARLRRTT